MTHHALAGWPGWEGWAEALGGRFHYAPGRLRGRDWPSSGTRIASSGTRRRRPTILCAPASATSRSPTSSTAARCSTSEVVPLLRTDAPMDGRLFTSTYEHVLVGEAAGT